ncbi:MAG: ABC transporter ATP-binding protein [Ruminococcaceae bacterium]|nr:ABC transporter ATP-binding protein [Oscillospiraceae bacterium]
MLDLKNLFAGYDRKHPILKDVSLTANSGEITVLLGRNGSGKSTLLHTVIGAIHASGQILANGIELATLKPNERAKHLSFLPQRLPAPALSVKETVALGLTPQRTRLGEAEWRLVDEKIEALGITALSDRAVSTLSGGERQKVFLALMLTQDTDILLFDEPTTYADAPFTALFYSLLRKERAKGKTILLVMHHVGEALTLADRVAVLQNGSLAFCGTPAEALEREIPEKCFELTRYTAKRDGKTAVFFKAE